MVSKETIKKFEEDKEMYKMIISGLMIMLLFFVCIWVYAMNVLSNEIVFDIQEEVEVDRLEIIIECEDFNNTRSVTLGTGRTYMMIVELPEEFHSLEITSNHKEICTQSNKSFTEVEWRSIKTSEGFEEFRESEYCEDFEDARKPDCGVALTYGFRFQRNPISYLDAYCVYLSSIGSQSKYACGKYTVYTDDLKHLNKKFETWYR